MGVQYDIAENAFGKWMKTQSKKTKEVRDPVADSLVAALSNLSSDKSFKLGNKGYVVCRSKGRRCLRDCCSEGNLNWTSRMRNLTATV